MMTDKHNEGKCEWCEKSVDWRVSLSDQPDYHDCSVCNDCYEKYGWNRAKEND